MLTCHPVIHMVSWSINLGTGTRLISASLWYMVSERDICWLLWITSQAIIWTNAGILLIGPLATNFSEILIEIYIFSFKKTHMKNGVCEMVSILSQPQWVNICHFFILHTTTEESYIVGLEQDCSNSIANALELLQSCTKPSVSISSLRPRDTYMHQ